MKTKSIWKVEVFPLIRKFASRMFLRYPLGGVVGDELYNRKCNRIDV